MFRGAVSANHAAPRRAPGYTVALDPESRIAEQAKEHQRQAGRDKLPVNLPEAHIETREEIAKAAGMSASNVAKVKFIRKHPDCADLDAAVAAGTMSIHAAWKEVAKAAIKWPRARRKDSENLLGGGLTATGQLV